MLITCPVPEPFERYLLLNEQRLREIPKWRRKTKLGPECIYLFARLTPPIKRETIFVPGLSQSPLLRQRDNRAAWLMPLPAPTVNMFFRPEEQDRLSGKDYIIPPLSWRDRDMDHARCIE